MHSSHSYFIHRITPISLTESHIPALKHSKVRGQGRRNKAMRPNVLYKYNSSVVARVVSKELIFHLLKCDVFIYTVIRGYIVVGYIV